MKKAILSFLLLCSQFSFSSALVNPVMPTLSNISVCDNDAVPNDGYTSLNLEVHTPTILGAQTLPSSNYTVSYYFTLTAAQSGTGAIINSTAFVGSNGQITYVRVENNTTSEFAIGSFGLIVSPLIIPTFAQIAPVCQGSVAPQMPTTSTNGPITGTWSPAVINTSNAGVITMAFTPDAGQCAASTTMTITVIPAPTINIQPNFSTCDNDNDGYYLYPLNVLIPGILGSQNPANFTVTFYNSFSDAVMEINAISNLANYQTYTHSIYIRVANNTTACFSISSFTTTIEQYPTPVIQTSNDSNAICVDYTTGNILAPLTLSAVNMTNYLIGTPPPTYTYEWYMDGVIIPGAIGSSYTVANNLPDGTSAVYSVVMTSQNLLGCSSSSMSYVVIQSGPASPIGIGYTIVNNSGNQTITINIQGYGIYLYAFDGGAPQSSPVFTNVPVGTHTVVVYDTEGGNFSCNYLVINGIDVNTTPVAPPTGNTTQSFSQGATLTNVLVNGQNIQWYSGADRNVSSVPLPLSTLLVNNTTYFASQKIGGYESTSRLPVLVQLVLNNNEFETAGLNFSPNPVVDNLILKSNDVIKNISVYTILGQLIMDKDYNGSDIQIDLSSLNSGNYFVKIRTDSKQHFIKVIKK